MPKPNIELHFSQNDFLKYSNQYDKKGGVFSINNAKTSDLKKMVTWNGIDYSISDGYCYGFSNAFLSYSSIGKGDDYLNTMKSLINIVNDESVYENKYDEIRIQALKKHAKFLLNEYMQDVIFSHRLETNSSTIYSNLFYNYTSEIKGRSFIEYMNDSIMEGASSYKKYKEKDKNKHKYIDYLSELQKAKIKYFLDTLNDEFNQFEKKRDKLFRDPWFREFHNAFYSRKDTLGEHFTIKDANFAKEMVLKSIEYDEYYYQKEINKINGIDLNPKLHSYNGRVSYRNEINLNKFIEKISNHTKSSKETQLFEFKAPAHSMALSINYNERTKSWDYAFFDPNYGVLKYYNESDFNVFLVDFVEKHVDYYGFSKDKDGKYVIAFSEFQVSENRRLPLNELNLENVKITENILLANNKTTVYLSESKENKIIYQDFNSDNNVSKVELQLNGAKKIVYTDILNVAELTSLINENIQSISNVSGDIFISHHENRIYKVNKGFDISNITGFSKGIDYDDINLHIKPIFKNSRGIITGIPDLHQQAIMQVANEENIIIGIRPVDEKSTSLILSGEYSSKGLSIKSKSADWGPHCGFIPVLQEYAKRSGRENKNKYNLYTQQAIDNGYAKSTILELTPERVNELTVYNEITPLEKINGSEYSKTISILDGQEKKFLLKKVNRDEKYFWHVYHEDEGNIKPFHVIADPITGKTLTADYDLFTVIFPFSELEHYVKVTEMPSWSEWKSNVIYEELTAEQKKLYNNKSEYNKKEGKDNGITNKRVKEINKKLNNKIGRQDGFELIHHGADDANPASVMNDNFPITFFLPEKLKGKNKLSGSPESIDTYFKMNAQGAIIINDVEQLSNLQQLLINQGYRVPLNKKWSEGDLAKYFDKKRKISATHIEKTVEIQRRMNISPDTVSGQENNIEKSLGKPVVQLDSGFDDVYLEYEKQHNMEIVAGEHSPNTNYIDLWSDPMAHYWDLKSRDAETNRIIKPTEYDYNVIIQLENDAVIKRVVANAFSKHPDDSMVIQYDIQTKQWKVLHGDLDRVKQGKVRYITAGHGDYKGHNQSTLYAGYTANQYADGINHLRKKLLNNKAPDKLVLIGCNLGRGGASENFAFKATNALAEHGMHMPITAYNRPLMNMYLGNKLIVPDPTIRESVSTKGHKFIYQYLPDAQQIRINKSSSILYFINEFRRGELKLNQLNSYSEPDVFAVFRHPETRNLNFDLLKTVAYNPEIYQLFVSKLKHHNGVLPESFYHDFSQKMGGLDGGAVPIWKMVDARHILHYSLSNLIPNDASLTVIVRLANDPKGLVQAEKLAARNPQNTLIFQMDVDAKNWMLEYGSAELSYLLESPKKAQWVIIGDAATVRKPTDDLASTLLSIKQAYPFTTPEQVLFHSISPTMITDSGEQQLFTSNLSTKLKQLGIDATVSSKFTQTDLSRQIHSAMPIRGVSLITDSGLARKIVHSQIQSLFEKLALNKLSIEDIRLVDHPYLAEYFTDGTGNLDIKKMGVALYDPLINQKVNQFLNQDNNNDLLSWNGVFESTLPKNYQQQAADIHTLLFAIKNDLSVLNNVGDHSIGLLKTLFPTDDGFDKGKVLDLVTDHNKFTLFSDKLDRFSQISDSHFDGENAPLKGLSFFDAMNVYENSQAQRLKQYNQLLSYQNRTEAGYHSSLINHEIIRSNKSAQSVDQTLGAVYAIEYHLTDRYKARDILEQKAQLERAKQQGILTDSGHALLDKMQQYEQDINTRVKHSGIMIADQSISALFSSEADSVNGIVFLKGKLVSYTVIQVKRNGVYEFSLFDPQGIQFTSENTSLQAAKHQFKQHLKNYFNQTIELADGKSISRGSAAGFQLTSNGDFRTDIQCINLEDHELKAALSEPLNQRTLIREQAEFNSIPNRWIELNGEKIAFSKLQHLGATIDGKPISLRDMALPNQHKNIRFSPEKLAMYFTLMDGSKDDIAFMKIFNEQLSSADIYQLVERDANFAESGVLKKQFKYLANGVDIQHESISSSTLQKMRQAGTRLPLFHRMANRFGQSMGGAGAIQSLIGAYSILNRLDNPDISAEEAKELEKQFYLLCASAFFNYGDMIIQPMLLNIASNKSATSLVRARISTGVVVIFNLVGMGIDIYQAYDSLSKLDSVTDPKQRQDLIVNASFSIISAVVNGVTVIAVLVGASSIPVAGLVIGGILLVGGWVYNGVRAVENIKTVIDIDWDRELEEGIRGALGLEPTLRSQQEMSTQLYINAFKDQDWQMDLAQFENSILQAGFDHHLCIVEKPTYQNEPRYYLVDDDDNHFYGTLKNEYYGMNTWGMRYTAKDAPSFTAEEVEFILANKVIRKTAWYRNLNHLYGTKGKNLRKHFRPHKKAKEVIDLKRTGSESTHERYYLNSTYENALLDEFQTRHRISDADATLSLEDQLASSDPEQISFYSKNREFGVLGQQMLQENERRLGEHLVNDRQRTHLYLQNPHSRGTSWNTANGNDVLIGHQEQKNAFQVLSGEKYFAGGNKDDLFYIRDSSLTSLRSRGDNKPTKYLDGQQGQDTVVVDNLPDGYDVHANLALNSLHYKHPFTHQFISVAHLQSIENILIKGNSNDRLCGNDEANILDGGLGKDLLIGEGGNDKLILTQGTAVGGQGDDSYHIRRFDWRVNVGDLYLANRYWDKKLKAVKTKMTLNPIYQHNNQQYHVKVVIDESSQSQSIVSLEYSLNEIKQVYLQDNNLYLVISLPSAKVDDFTYSNVDSSVTVVLNNVTVLSQGQQKANHTYRLHMKDGFVMTSQIKALDEGEPTQFFNISYIQENDPLTSSGGKSVNIDEALNAITINQNRHHIAPSWGWFTPIGRAENLVYQGDGKNNLLSLVSSGSYIHVSRGIDTYQIIHAEDERSTITFDFASVNGQFTADDKVILLLPTDNGYALSMEGLTLYSKDKFSQRQLAINFVNVDDKLADIILIQDRNSNVFSLDLQTQSITPLKPISKGSESNDEIILPIGYLSDQHVIDGKSGDDIIVNRSLASYILVGGDGDDSIKAIDGNNVLYGGSGDNFLSGGEGDDLLLSSQGNDILMGEAGNDHYIIDGNHSGTVYLEDNLGDNHIHLINFKPQVIEDSFGETQYHLYVSQAGKIVKIKQPTEGRKASITVHHYEKLEAEYFLPTKNGMTPLVDYLSVQQDLAKQSGRLATWKPVNELAETLKGIAKPLKQTSGNDGILLNKNASNEHLLIDTLDGDDEIVDHSSQGRVIKGGNGNDKLIAFGGENVLYGGEGNDILLAQGMGQDVLISLTGNDMLAGNKGDDLYIVSGHGQGNVVINDFEGRNQVALIDFKIDAIRYQEVSPTIAETIYQSYSGRTVTLRHNNHQGLMAHVMQVSHINSHQKLSQQNVDLTIDRLIQLLAEQRIEHESNVENQSKKNSSIPHWGAVSTTEHFLNVL
ncbi:RTX toxin [Providencia alcalifaciens]|uniref:C80 family cysteine peptidase n=1 Tax=Providencia alcalifaciens TaxID=126385 RepID=UPI001CE120A0|nr:anthrax toxin-like adenylyl cyclase domain-containing protein [Providencia alcalifaciens]UBX48088.1 RTX toxin [Providencia alcalifaciens]